MKVDNDDKQNITLNQYVYTTDWFSVSRDNVTRVMWSSKFQPSYSSLQYLTV